MELSFLYAVSFTVYCVLFAKRSPSMRYCPISRLIVNKNACSRAFKTDERSIYSIARFRRHDLYGQAFLRQITCYLCEGHSFPPLFFLPLSLRLHFNCFVFLSFSIPLTISTTIIDVSGCRCRAEIRAHYSNQRLYLIYLVKLLNDITWK